MKTPPTITIRRARTGTLGRIYGKPRPLSWAEKETLHGVFCNSVDYSKVVIIEGNFGILSQLNPDGPFVVGNTLCVPPGASLGTHTLVQNMVYVWQYQNGVGGHVRKEIGTRMFRPAKPHGSHCYKDNVMAGKPFAKLHPEQQAQLIADAFSQGALGNAALPFELEGSDGTKMNATDYVRKAWKMLKDGKCKECWPPKEAPP